MSARPRFLAVLLRTDFAFARNQYLAASHFLSSLVARIAIYPFDILFLLLIAALLDLSHSALLDFYNYYGFDQWFFIYAGQRVLDGAIPYLAFWDNKPPLIYFLNAAGLFWGNGSVWGVCVLDAFFFVLATYVSFIFLKKAFGRQSAFFGCCVWLTAASITIDGGNGVTNYALPFFFMAWLWFFLLISTQSFEKYSFLFGMTAGVLFLLKPNFIGTQIAMSLPASIYLYQNGRWRLLFKCLLLALSGALLIVSVPIMYLIYHHAMTAFIDQVFIFPGRYLVSAYYSDWMNSLKFGVGLFRLQRIIVCLGLLAIIFQLRKSNYLTKEQKWLAFAVIVTMPTEVFLSCLSGRPWLHYFLTWIPFIAVLSTFAVSAFIHYQWFDEKLSQDDKSQAAKAMSLLQQLFPILALMTTLGVIVTMPTNVFSYCMVWLPWKYYFHLWMPFFTALWVLAIFAFFRYRWSDRQHYQANNILTMNAVKILKYLLPIVVAIVIAINPIKYTVSLIKHPHPDFNSLIAFLGAYIEPERSIFSWGAIAKVNFLLHKPPPDRFTTQEPLFIKKYAKEEMISELISVIHEKKPIIVDATFYSLGVIPSLNPHIMPGPTHPVYSGFRSWGQTPVIKKSMEAFYKLIAEEYQIIGISSKERWVVLEHKSYLSDPNSKSLHRLSQLSQNFSPKSGVYIFNPESYKNAL